MEDNTNDSGSAVDGLLNDDFDISMSLDPTAIHTAGGSAEIDQDPTAVAARKRRPMVKLTGEKLACFSQRFALCGQECTKAYPHIEEKIFL